MAKSIKPNPGNQPATPPQPQPKTTARPAPPPNYRRKRRPKSGGCTSCGKRR